MQKRLSTIWLTTLTLITLVFSTIAGSASQSVSAGITSLVAMPETETPVNHRMSTTSHETHCLSTLNATHIEMHEDCCGKKVALADAECCSGSGLVIYSLITAPFFSYQQRQHLALISQDAIRHPRHIPNPLLRPPIA
jgi:hypothetical protein